MLLCNYIVHTDSGVRGVMVIPRIKRSSLFFGLVIWLPYYLFAEPDVLFQDSWETYQFDLQETLKPDCQWRNYVPSQHSKVIIHALIRQKKLYVNTSTCTYIYIYWYTYLCISMYIYVCLCLSLYIFVYLCISTYIYGYLCISTYIYV